MARTNHQQWNKTSYTLGRLHPDLENPRLHTKASNDKEAYQALAECQDVASLCREISNIGYLPVEDLVVVVEGGRNIVVEGNRRLTAYKLLKDPGLAPPKLRKTFENLSSNYGNSLPSKFYVVVAPNRAEANVYVYKKHTPTSFSKDWDKIQQAVFIQRLLNNYDSPEEAIQMETQISKSDAVSSLLTLTLFELVPHLDISDAKKLFLSNPNNFPYSTVIERLLEKPFAAEYLGIRPSLSNGIEFAIEQESAVRILSCIMDHATEPDPEDPQGKKMKLDTRALGKITEQKSYMQSLDVPETRNDWKPIKKLSGTEDNVEENPEPITPAIQQKAKKRLVGNGLFSEKLIYRGEKCMRLPDLLKELQTHKPLKNHVNSLALLLRSTIELAMIAWLKKSNHWNEANQRAKNKRIGPMMSEMIDVLKDYYKSELGLSPQEQNAVKTFLNDFSMDTLNAFVHNPHYPVDESSLKNSCVKVFPLLKALLA